MKNIFIILFLLFLGSVANSQPIVQRAGPANTVSDARIKPQYNFIVPVYADTATANLTTNIGIDSCYAVIATRDSNYLWYRQCSPKKWVKLGSGGSGGGVSGNIYTIDGSLLGDRTATLGTYYLAFNRSGVKQLSLETVVSRISSPDNGEYLELYNDSILLVGGSQTIQIKGDTASFSKRASYASNLGSTFTRHTLVDKNYVDSANTSVISTAWSLSGNTLAGGVGSFLGSLNNRSIRFRVNNLERFRFDTLGGIRLYDAAGAEVMWIHTDDYVNLFIGRDAGSVNNFAGGGSDNTGIGYAVLNKNTTGQLNTAVGKRAMTENITGVQNSAFGAGSFQNNISNFNVGVGYHSGLSNTSGNSNVAVGTEAMLYDSNGVQNTVVGRGALQNGTSTSFNTAIGAYSLVSSNGGNNTAIGVNSFYSNTTGTGNVGMGVNVGYNATGSYNVFLGRQAGYGITGDQNVIIGDNTGFNASSRSNRLMIDNTTTDRPLIDGDFAADTLMINGTLYIRTTANKVPADTSTYKPVWINTTTGEIAKSTFHYQTPTPTFQQVLTAGSTLTTDNAIDLDGNNLSVDGGNVISIASNGAGTGGQRVDFSAANSVNGQNSQIFVYGDSIIIRAGTGGTINVDSLRSWNNIADTVRKKPMTWNKDNGAWEYLDFWPTGGGASGLTIGTTTIASGSTKRILYDSAATLSSNAQFAWDFTNKRLGVGTDAPSFPFHLYESTTNTTTAGGRIENAGNGDAVLHFLRGSANFSIGMDQSVSDRFKISASATLGTNDGITIASDGSVGLAGASPSAKVTFPAGTASAFTAAAKFTSGTIMTTAEAGALEYNGNFYATKVNNVRYGVGGSLRVNTTDVGNVGTGVDDLMSYSIPASTLSTNNEYIEFSFTFTFAANANNKTVRVVYGATEIYNSTAQAQNGGSMEVIGKIIRTGATTQKVIVSVSTDGTLYTDLTNYTTAAETLSGAVTLKATGEATSNNDIVNVINTVKYYPSN